MSRDEATLLDIAQAARLILEFKQNMDKAAFLSDIKTQSAILHQLLVMRGGREAALTRSACASYRNPLGANCWYA
jgi:uncharacterized protein with HEPN domain